MGREGKHIWGEWEIGTYLTVMNIHPKWIYVTQFLMGVLAIEFILTPVNKNKVNCIKFILECKYLQQLTK
jgi:hypothetical protein